MKVGDKKQAVLLSVVAVGAVGFLYMQLRKPGAAVIAAAVAAVTDAPAAVQPPTELPKRLYGDPFYHPLLLQVDSKAPKDSPEAGDSSASKTSHGSGRYVVKTPAPLEGPMPGVDEAVPDQVPYAPQVVSAEPHEKKAEAAKPKGPALSLTAVVTGQSPVALLSVDTSPTRQFVKGQQIAKGVFVMRIRDGAIEISSHGKIVALQVGKKLQL